MGICHFYNQFYVYSKYVSANRTLPKNELSSKGPGKVKLKLERFCPAPTKS